MEARARGHVELQVRVMHAVQPPQCGNRVEKHMLQVDGEIEGQHGQRHADPYRQRERVEEAPSLRLGHQGETNGGRRKQQANQNRVEHDNADVARPARPASDPLVPARRNNFPGRHHSEDAGKGEEPDHGLVAEQQFRHRESLTTRAVPPRQSLTAVKPSFKLSID